MPSLAPAFCGIDGVEGYGAGFTLCAGPAVSGGPVLSSGGFTLCSLMLFSLFLHHSIFYILPFSWTSDSRVLEMIPPHLHPC